MMMMVLVVEMMMKMGTNLISFPIVRPLTKVKIMVITITMMMIMSVVEMIMRMEHFW